MHDWWCYLVVSAFGKVIFDSQPCAFYRQHGRNVVGTSTSTFHPLDQKVLRQFRQDSLRIIVSQTQAFLNQYGSSAQLDASVLKRARTLVADATSARLAVVLDRGIRRQFVFDDLLLRIRLIAHYWSGQLADGRMKLTPPGTSAGSLMMPD